MKKLIYSLLLLLTVVGVQRAEAKIQYGVVAGLNLSKLSLSGNATQNLESDNRCGWYLGPKVEFTLPIVGLGINASLQYSQRKIADLTMDNLNGDVNDTKTLRSIELPINVKYTLGFSSLVGAFIYTGPQFGFNVGNKGWLQNSYKLKTADVTWNVGLGVKVLNHLEVGAGYNFAVTKLASLSGKNTPSVLNKELGDLKTNTWQVQVAYMF